MKVGYGIDEDKYLRILEPYQKRTRGSEDRKVYDQFFDKRTLLLIYELMNEGTISTVDFPIATGKEGGVFKCTSSKGAGVAMKVYRISNSTFRSLAVYISGDERFRGITGNFSKTISMWVQREFVNLERYFSHGLLVPEPIAHRGNLLVMQYLGTDDGPSPLLKDSPLEAADLAKFYVQLIDFIVSGYRKAGLVHSDLSQYNVMVHEGKPFVIDCSQGVTARHPNALDFARRDITNINRFFRQKGVAVHPVEEVVGMMLEAV